jgi:hypothetical protein
MSVCFMRSRVVSLLHTLTHMRMYTPDYHMNAACFSTARLLNSSFIV